MIFKLLYGGSDGRQKSQSLSELAIDDVADTEKKCNALAEGGKVTGPLQDTFWGAKFGTLTDAYGIHWMFNCELKKA